MVTAINPILSGSAPIQKEVYLSQFFELLDLAFQRKKRALIELYPNQQSGFPAALDGKTLVIRDDTGTGKTYTGTAALQRSLSQGLIGVYLVPTRRLAQDKWEELSEFFSIRTENGERRELAHVIQIAGESRPPKAELRKNCKRLIIVATYEAFRAFCFDVQNRKYFPKRKCFGTVVVDEAHNLGDRTRGMSLHSLIFKLRKEYDPQICFLSATFAKEDVKWWCEQLGAKEIYFPPKKKYPYAEVIIEEGEGGQLQKVCNEIRETVVVESGEGDYKYLPKRVLVFCSTRWLAEEAAQRIWKENWCGESNPECWCEIIHAGLTLQEQNEAFEMFRRRKGVKILVSSPLLEAGVDVPGIDLIIVVDPERYPAFRLNQICGRILRTREKDGKVVFIINEQYQDRIYQKIELNEDHTEIINFNLKYVFEEFPKIDLPRLILEQLFWHQRSETEIRDELYQLNRLPQYEDASREDFKEQFKSLIDRGDLNEQINDIKQIIFQSLFWQEKSVQELEKQLMQVIDSPEYQDVFAQNELRHQILDLIGEQDVGALLDYLIEKELVRKVGGKYALTFMGDAVMETGLDVATAVECLAFLKDAPLPSSSVYYQGISFYAQYNRLIARLVAERAVSDINNLERRRKRKQAIVRFMMLYSAKTPAENRMNRRVYTRLGYSYIPPGDEETLRRTAIWIAASTLALYKGLLLHHAPRRLCGRSYYDRISIKKLAAPQRMIYLFLRKNIRRFQLPGSPRLRRKPDPRPRGGYYPKARYTKLIEATLQSFGKEGATVREIIKKNRRSKRDSFLRLFLPFFPL